MAARAAPKLQLPFWGTLLRVMSLALVACMAHSYINLSALQLPQALPVCRTCMFELERGQAVLAAPGGPDQAATIVAAMPRGSPSCLVTLMVLH